MWDGGQNIVYPKPTNDDHRDRTPLAKVPTLKLKQNRIIHFNLIIQSKLFRQYSRTLGKERSKCHDYPIVTEMGDN